MEESGIIKYLEICSSRGAAFEALTEPNAIRAYFPIDEVIADWKEGGTIKFVGEQSGVDEGTIDVLEQNSRFEFSYWNENHGREKKPENFVTISYSVEDTDDVERIKLTMNQKNLPSAEYREMMEPIWDELLGSFKSYVERRTRRAS